MTLIPKSKTQIIIPKQDKKEKQTKLSKENYEKLKRLTGRQDFHEFIKNKVILNYNNINYKTIKNRISRKEKIE